MRLEKDGRIIEKVKINKKDVIIYFSDEEKIKISEATYVHFYLYNDKVLSNEEYDEIIEYEKFNKSREYAVNILSKKYYTEKEIFEKLTIKKKLNSIDANKVVSYLKEHGFINDENYFEEYVEHLHNKNFGKNKIISKCYEEGFKSKLIESLTFDMDFEIDKASIQLRKYIFNKNKNKQKLKEGAYSHLLNQGFDFEIASQVISIIDQEYDSHKEKELLKKEVKKILSKKHINLNDFNEKQKLIESLIRKGYKYEDIKKEIRSEEYEIC